MLRGMANTLGFEPLKAHLDAVGVSVRSLGWNGARRKQVEKDGLSWEAADRVAVQKLGVHPSVIWSDWGDLGDDEIGDDEAEQLTLSGV